MKANELMIGDWVLYNETLQQILEISGIDDEVYLETDELVHQSEIQPISLTPEILEKNGFIHYTDFYMWKEESLEPIHLDNYDEDGWRLRINCDNIPCECKYVHQLQHALRLCGIEKEIIL